MTNVPNLLLLSLGGDAPSPVPNVPQLHLGHVGDDRLLAAAYSASDVFVIPSLQEAFGQTALEAAACGTPSVGFNVGGISDVVQDGETGLLVPPGDVPALRAAIMRLLGDRATRERMATAARETVVARFTLRQMTDAYLALYHSVLHK
jgi:glycosyltransferase involved in cell wall biosynthesis